VDGLRSALRRVDLWLMWAGCIAAALMMLQISADVAAKFLFGHPITATIEIVSTYYMVALVFLPLAFVDRTGGHIAADVLTKPMGPRLRAAVGMAMDVVVLITLGVLFWFTLEEAIRRSAEGEIWRSGQFLLPVWPSRWLLPIGSGMMALSALARLVAGRDPGMRAH
jgi:TRAP-type C4-dicarboxylate transport system permease small subunit